jgi:hypothetical protein
VAAPAVVDDVTAAAALVATGVHVVLVTDNTSAGVVLPVDGPGRLAVLVGSPEDPETRVAAEAMAAELFGTGA